MRKAAELLKLAPYLDRTPLNLSGGQQQRTALARAIVKKADLVLLDEPLANLDYKLREELREELPKIFAASGAIFVYATTEPSRGAAARRQHGDAVSEGRVTQFGPTIEVYRRPVDLVTAKTFADPPLNSIELRQARRRSSTLDGGVSLPVPAHLAGIADGPLHDRASSRTTCRCRPPQRAARAAARQRCRSDRDHRLGKLRAPRFRRRALGHAGAGHPRHRAGRRRSRCSSTRATSWCSAPRAARLRHDGLSRR